MLPTQTPPNHFTSPRVLLFSSQSNITLHTQLPIKTPFQKDSNFIKIRTKRLHFTKSFFRKSGSGQSNDGSNLTQDDFVTRVLKENPCQVEPRYKIGDKLYTLKEKENLGKKSFDGNGPFEILKRLSNNRSRDSVDYSNDVYLNDILRKFKGKLYVPEQIFVDELSEEAEFNKEFEVLPRMTFEDLQKCIKTDMIKFVTFKEDDGVSYGKDFIVELKEIPGDKNLQRTKW